MGLLSSKKPEPAPQTTNWALVRDGHAAAAVKAAARGDQKKAKFHQEQQAAAAVKARESGMWWIHS
ncbi:hypothetical protein FLW53_09740 [Microbispora sp. SCL1-1]|uniref:hypothetical protein n=1 Tax=unclassified Microbispora TaxID=2614687 RepID=UPI0011583D69|nr:MULTISPECIES: hypothetical protein [unclassified Microbispora]NJP24486.1 hypothetical protein [Microbispora sp. CL1-1]TQS14632.1 hypothetical protein FLW53_09740 [Microbispora sp. SCL1-1]